MTAPVTVCPECGGQLALQATGAGRYLVCLTCWRLVAAAPEPAPARGARPTRFTGRPYRGRGGLLSDPFKGAG